MHQNMNVYVVVFFGKAGWQDCHEWQREIITAPARVVAEIAVRRKYGSNVFHISVEPVYEDGKICAGV